MNKSTLGVLKNPLSNRKIRSVRRGIALNRDVKQKAITASGTSHLKASDVRRLISSEDAPQS